MIILIAFLVFTVSTLWLRSRNKGLGGAGVIVFSAYSLSFFFASVMVLVEGRESTWEATVFFLTVLLLFILPLVSLKPVKVDNCPPPEWTPLHSIFGWCLALVGCYATLTTAPSAIRLLFSGQLGAVREAVYTGLEAGTTELDYKSMLASGVWPAALSCFVFAMIARRPIPLLCALGVGSMPGATAMMVVAGRSGIVYLAMQATVVVMLAWPVILKYRPELRRPIIMTVVVGGGLTLFLTIYVAIARGIGGSGTFSVVSNSDVFNALYSIVIYVGSAIVNFQDFWFIHDDFNDILMGQRCFPVIAGILKRLGLMADFNAADIGTIYKPYYDAYNLEHAVFNGFQRELVMDFGRWGTLAGSAVWAAIVVVARRRYERRLDWFSLASMSFFASVPLLGIFFMSYGELQGNISLAAMLGSMGFFWVTGKNSRSSKKAQSSPGSSGPVLDEVRPSSVRP